MKKLHRYLSYFNNLLLIPLFTFMVLETGVRGPEAAVDMQKINLFFCASFFLEWVVGIIAADDRKAFAKNPVHILDLVSSIPFGFVFQGLRLVRLLRIVRILRVILRARRFRGRGARLVRAAGIVGATVFAGALGLRVVEPQTVPEFQDAIWWSLVTMSTVGYGDVMPQTDVGRAVASVLIIFGIGVFGYVAGFMGSIIDDPEDDEMIRRLMRIEKKLDAMAASHELAGEDSSSIK